MNRRSVLLLLATLVAVIGTALVFVYVRSADNRATEKFDTVDVLTAVGSRSRPARRSTSAQARQARRLTAVPQAAGPGRARHHRRPRGPGRRDDDLPRRADHRRQVRRRPVVEAPLAIPKGMQAISVELTDPGAGRWFREPGLRGGDLPRPGGRRVRGHATVSSCCLKRVLVLGVGVHLDGRRRRPRRRPTAPRPPQEVPKTLLTIAVSQKDAEKVICADTPTAS